MKTALLSSIKLLPFALLLLSASCTKDTGPDVQSAENNQPSITLEAPPYLLLQLEAEESIRSIKTLQRAYAQYLNAGLWEDAANLFSSMEAKAQFGDQVITGMPGIADYLAQRYGGEDGELSTGELNEHLILSPVINLSSDGNSALGRWRLVSLQGSYGNDALWEGGIFENSYVKEGGVWRISHLNFYPIYGGEYTAGWRMFKDETNVDVEPVPFHYDADGAGIPIPAELSSNGGSSTSTVTLAELDQRAQRLLDEDKIISLQNAYGYYQDRMMWDDLADLFHSDASLELGHRGVYRGQESIRHAFEQFGSQPLSQTLVNDHLQLQPVVTLSEDGLTARIRGTEFKSLGVHEESSQWGIGTFSNEFIKVDGEWQISAVHVFDRMLTDYNEGWARHAYPEQSAAEGYEADEPSSQDYAIYPDFFVPDISFSHPVLQAEAAQIRDATGSSVSAEGTEGAEGIEEELERKLRVLNAYDGAENVSNAYGYYIDEFLWDGMADVFSTSGWKELSGIGSFVGRERVRQSVVSRYGRGGRRANSMTYHQKVQPVITVADDGYSAHIRTRLFQLNSSRENPGSFISGIYENQIVIEDGIWRIQGMDLDYTWSASYVDGWQGVSVRTGGGVIPPPATLTGEQAPDRPLRGLVSAPYPTGQVDMAFHYLNPVSGRQPSIYLPDVDYDALGED